MSAQVVANWGFGGCGATCISFHAAAKSLREKSAEGEGRAPLDTRDFSCIAQRKTPPYCCLQIALRSTGGKKAALAEHIHQTALRNDRAIRLPPFASLRNRRRQSRPRESLRKSMNAPPTPLPLRALRYPDRADCACTRTDLWLSTLPVFANSPPRTLAATIRKFRWQRRSPHSSGLAEQKPEPQSPANSQDVRA